MYGLPREALYAVAAWDVTEYGGKQWAVLVQHWILKQTVYDCHTSQVGEAPYL